MSLWWTLPLVSGAGHSEGAGGDKVCGRRCVCPCLRDTCPHRCNPHTWSRWRHAPLSPRVSGSLSGLKRLHLPAFHLQSLKPVRGSVHSTGTVYILVLWESAGVRCGFLLQDYLKSLQRFNIKHIFIGGRSMGSRAAAALARQLSEGTEGAVQGVICLSFPLHPPGQTHTHRQRSEDLRALPEHVPVLFVSGTEDNMCDKVLFDTMVTELKAPTEVYWVKGGSHGLSVKGRSEESVIDEVNLQVITWISKQEAQIS
nr:PREDICTED: testis-expressed sequence 30 protein isoform X1 [Paralichthys olivaceus]